MFTRPQFAPTARRGFMHSIATCTLLAGASLITTTCPAATLADSAESLRFAPADVAFYSASLRLQEQFDIFLNSRTYERLMQVPVIQLAKMQIAFQWEQLQEPAVVRVRDYFKSADGQQSFAVLKDMFTEEVFVYGSHEWAGILQFFAEFNSMQRQVQFDSLIKQAPPEEAAKRLTAVFKDRLLALEIPQTMFGFRLKEPAQATEHLAHLQTSIIELIKEEVPQLDLEPHFQSEDIAGHKFITLRLDGSMIPWDEIRSGSNSEIDDATFNEWRDVFSRKHLIVALGVVDEFLLVFVGNSTEPIEKLGQGKLLVDSGVLDHVSKHADQRLTGISYASAEIAQSVDSQQANLDGLVALTKSGLEAANIEATRRDEIVSNVKALAENLATYLPKPGSFSAASFLTPRGVESFQYRSGVIGQYVSSQPLAMLDHAGGNPLFLLATHSEQTVAQYDATIAAAHRVFLDAEEVAQKLAPAEQWTEYQKWRPKVLGLLTRLNTTTRENLFPALADGQAAIVVGAGAASTTWIADMPPAEKPLPVFEIGLVGGVADVARLKAAMTDYFKITQDTIALLHEANPNDFPDFTLEQPVVGETGGAATYQYSLPAEWNIDSQVVPNASLAENVWAVSVFPTFTAQLIESKPLEIDSPIDIRRPAAIVVHAKLPKLLDAIRPWVDYGFTVAAAKTAEEGGDPQAAAMPAGFILPQVHQMLDVLSALDSYTSVTYREDDVWVTHAELHLDDKAE